MALAGAQQAMNTLGAEARRPVKGDVMWIAIIDDLMVRRGDDAILGIIAARQLREWDQPLPVIFFSQPGCGMVPMTLFSLACIGTRPGEIKPVLPSRSP